MKMEIRTITPDLAFSWLQKNRDNRKIRIKWVKDLTAIIQRGEFKLTHQGIAFSETGRLLDGQHRLLAIVDAGIAVQMVVTYDVPSDTFAMLDTGQRRSFADMYGADAMTVGVSRLLSEIVHNRYSPTQQNEIHNIIAKPMNDLRLFCNSNKRGISVASVHTAAVLRMLVDEDQEYIKLVYWNLIHTKHSELPPVGRLFIDQIYGKLAGASGGGSNRSDLLSRALKVFDKNNANAKSLRITDVTQSYDFARAIILPLLETTPIKKPTSKASAVTRAKSVQLSHVKAA